MPVMLDRDQKKALRASNWKRAKPYRWAAAFVLLAVAAFLALHLPDQDASTLTSDQAKAIDLQETYEGVLPDSVPVYASVEELYAASDLVIEGEVVRVSGDQEDLDRAYILVDTVLKGEAGNTIILREDAGSVPLMEQYQHLILFLVCCDPEESLDDYRLTGSYQGKFIEHDGLFFQQATADVKLPEEVYSPLTKDEFFTLLGYTED